MTRRINTLIVLLVLLPIHQVMAESLEIPIRTAADDREETLTSRRFPLGTVYRQSSDLELGASSDHEVASMPQAVGLLFRRVDISPNATIDHATIQFTTDETGDLDTSILIYGDLSPNARPISTRLFDITSRPKTAATVEWNEVPAWNRVGESGPDQRSPDLSEIVQEIIDQPDWQAKNSMAFVFTVTRENFRSQRVAVAYDGNASAAPRLIIDYSLGVTAGDFNGDGILDVDDANLLLEAIEGKTVDSLFDVNGDNGVTIGDLDTWVKDLSNTWYGDANLDGEFSSEDLVKVFQANQYEDSVAQNSRWAEGDWNADLEFTSNDLVLAFQDGGFELGPRESVLAVAEPSGMCLLSLSLIGIPVVVRKYRNAS